MQQGISRKSFLHTIRAASQPADEPCPVRGRVLCDYTRTHRVARCFISGYHLRPFVRPSCLTVQINEQPRASLWVTVTRCLVVQQECAFGMLCLERCCTCAAHTLQSMPELDKINI